MYKPKEYAVIQEERSKLNGVIQFLKEESEQLAAMDKQNDADMATFQDSKGLRGGFQVQNAETSYITGIAVDWTGTVWVYVTDVPVPPSLSSVASDSCSCRRHGDRACAFPSFYFW
jgi:hypothetical protein